MATVDKDVRIGMSESDTESRRETLRKAISELDFTKIEHLVFQTPTTTYFRKGVIGIIRLGDIAARPRRELIDDLRETLKDGDVFLTQTAMEADGALFLRTFEEAARSQGRGSAIFEAAGETESTYVRSLLWSQEFRAVHGVPMQEFAVPQTKAV